MHKDVRKDTCKDILIIDDEEMFAQALCQDLNESNLYNATGISGKKDFAQAFKKEFHLIFLDLRLREESGLNLLPEIRQRYPEAKIYLMTGFGTIATAVSAMKLGATDYLTKPITLEKIQALEDPSTSPMSQATGSSPTEPQAMSLDRVEREYIEHVLTQEEGNITKAAKKLGIHRQSLQRKLKRWVPTR